MLKQALIKRFQYLWTGELFASFFLPAIFAFGCLQVDHSISLLTIYGSLCLALILWQGAAYWRMNLSAVQQGQPIPADRLRPFRAWKIANWAALGVMPLVVYLRFFVTGPARFNYDAFGGTFLYILALLEQINYYYYQLSYDNRNDWAFLLRTRRLKAPALRRALDQLSKSA